MEKIQLQNMQPRPLHYRSHYKIYLIFFLVTCSLIAPYWILRFNEVGFPGILKFHGFEFYLNIFYIFGFSIFYFLWLRPKLKRSVQVFQTHVKLRDGKKVQDVYFSEVDSVTIVCWSLFYFKMKDGHKYYFNSSLERVDYIWEKIFETRPELMQGLDYEGFRLKLVQYDHHQKRKEWFFKHKFADVINWLVLPSIFIGISYMIQSQDIVIYQSGLYFFRLTMYSLLVLLLTTFLFSLVLKKLIFDDKLKKQMSEQPADKIRDMEFEGVIIQRSKFFQLIMSCFIFVFIVKMDVNLYSVTKVKDDIKELSVKKGTTVFVDNRFNCVNCRYELKEGDIVLFGRGYLGQVMARPGDYVGQTAGRGIASENVQQVPANHIAVKSRDGIHLSFIRMDELIGKVKK